jgi:hypothetical protein
MLKKVIKISLIRRKCKGRLCSKFAFFDHSIQSLDLEASRRQINSTINYQCKFCVIKSFKSKFGSFLCLKMLKYFLLLTALVLVASSGKFKIEQINSKFLGIKSMIYCHARPRAKFQSQKHKKAQAKIFDQKGSKKAEI